MIVREQRVLFQAMLPRRCAINHVVGRDSSTHQGIEGSANQESSPASFDWLGIHRGGAEHWAG